MDVYERIKRMFGWGGKPAQRPAPAPAPTPSPAPTAGASASAAPAPEASPSGPERRGKARRNARPGTRVLVIDDSPTIVALLKRMLRRTSYEVLEAFDAESGLEIARRADRRT